MARDVSEAYLAAEGVFDAVRAAAKRLVKEGRQVDADGLCAAFAQAGRRILLDLDSPKVQPDSDTPSFRGSMRATLRAVAQGKSS